ncbi:MAG: polysaccharide deacetylase family protein [Pseudomonadales bacterium]|nr:polysaccharide deacetylase family protein [Pseudomonadales bacterium]PHR53291.1 MAG: polysaccharide deacetylase [Arcobacter sp.]
MSYWWIIPCSIAVILFLRFSFRYAWWATAVDYKNPRILMYHMISDHKNNAKFNGLRVTPEAFEQQLNWLKSHDWNFVTMSELVILGNTLPRKSVALTFDDGFEDNYTNALPIMQRYGAKGTLYLVVDRHKRDWSTNKKAHHNSGELMQEPKLTDTQVTEMLQSGVFELGAHTTTHPNLSQLLEAEKTSEIAGSKQQLEKLFQTNIGSFAYPFGIYSQDDVRVTKRANFESAVTTEAGISELNTNNLLELKRVKISGKDNFFAFRMRMKHGQRGLRK